jgi:hypothetical protein
MKIFFIAEDWNWEVVNILLQFDSYSIFGVILSIFAEQKGVNWCSR